MNDSRMPGKAVPILVALGGLVLFGAMLQALVVADLRQEGAVLTELLWGRVLLIDVYLGFAIVAGWMGWREGAGLRAAIWILALFTLGNVIACAYIVHAWWASSGDGSAFWHGRRAAVK